MNKNSVIKGIGTAMAIGSAIAAVGSSMTSSGSVKKKMKKTATKAGKAIDNMREGMQDMINS